MPGVARVLVVDDDEDFRDALRAALATEGYDVLCAESGAAALDLMATVQPALLLVDVRMPAMSGPQLLLEMERRGWLKPYRVVMVSADAMRGGPRARWGLQKPIDLELLLRVVQELCNGATR